jgi:hypothetical protein
MIGAGPRRLKAGVHLTRRLQSRELDATVDIGGWGAKPTTDDQLGRPMQQCIGEKPGEFRGSLSEVILSQSPRAIPEMQGNEGQVQRLGCRSVGSSEPKRRGSHVECDIVCSMRRRIAVSEETAPNSRLGVNNWQHDNERGCSPLEEFECLLTERGLILLVHDKPGELREQPDRPILIQALTRKVREGATTIPKGSRTKRSEAPGLHLRKKWGDDIVSTAWEHAAAS